MVIAENRARALAFSMRTTKELVAADIYNRAFTGGPTYADGVSLINTAHPNINGPNWSNQLTTPADLSELSLEQAVIQIMRFTNDRGLLVGVMPKTLVVAPENAFNSTRILQSPLSTTVSTLGATGVTNTNAVNALKMGNYFMSEVVINPYLNAGASLGDAWFIRTNVPNGMKYLERRADTFTEDNDFDTDNLKYKATARYSFGVTDPRSMFGSIGA
jgi:hypothetical protein